MRREWTSGSAGHLQDWGGVASKSDHSLVGLTIDRAPDPCWQRHANNASLGNVWAWATWHGNLRQIWDPAD